MTQNHHLSKERLKVLDLFHNSHRCSEAILKIYGPQLGLDENLSMKIGCALGGGMGSTHHLCGAVSACVIILGLAFGRINSEDQICKEKTNQLVNLFIDKFLDKFKHLNCHELKDTQDNICNLVVEDATRILEEILSSELNIDLSNR